jgi:hypothetical protein
LPASKNYFRKPPQSDHCHAAMPGKHFSFVFSEIVLVCRHPVSAGGACRDRHDARGGDAVAVRARSILIQGADERVRADGEVVWS